MPGDPAAPFPRWADRAGVMVMGAELASASLPGRMQASLVGEWRQAGPAQQFAYLAGGALMLAGVAHGAAWLVAGGAWEGPVSFRKPTTFGLSFGLTTITLAWVTGWLRVTGRTRWLLLGPLAVADATEVAWVAAQRARGVASHFNFTTTLDAALFVVGGAAIAVTVTVIVAVTVLAFIRMQAAPSMAVAIRAGLVILLVAQGVGGWMIGHGVGPASDGVTQGLTTVAPTGVMKVPHAVAMHAIQVLPALAWLASFADLAERRRLWLVWTAAAGYGALVAVAVAQTAAGRAPFDLGAAVATLSLMGVALLGAAYTAALLALRRGGLHLTSRQPGPARVGQATQQGTATYQSDRELFDRRRRATSGARRCKETKR